MSNNGSRVENILKTIITGGDTSDLEPPQSRVEWLLMKLNEAVGKMDDINLFHICEHGEYDAVNLVPTIQNPQENLFYLVPSSTGDDKYTENGFIPAMENGKSSEMSAPIHILMQEVSDFEI